MKRNTKIILAAVTAITLVSGTFAVAGATQGQRIKDLINADAFDQGAALEMITARTTAMQTQGPELVAAAAQFFDGLNEVQKQELNELMDRFSDRRGDRSQKGN